MTDLPIAILYEHPEWFRPLFAELDRRGVPYEKLFVRDHHYDPAVRACAYSLVVNRVSAYPSGGSHPKIVLYVKEYLAHLESIGAAVVNGHHSFLVGASKAMQLDILARLGLRYPKTQVIHHPDQANQAADGLDFPVVVKPNVGGSGAGILKFNSPDELRLGVETGAIDLGIDHVGLIQEYLMPRDRFIVRVEVLDGEYLYAIRLPISEESFNYCPADGCNVENPDLAVEACSLPESIVQEVKSILAASRVDVGSVEYLVNEADGRVYYYDINPLSNFVADARNVVGFDPFARFVDYILERACMSEAEV
jgi:glutathione synthase/RimK-type ligase-like ATP-grasp enzyme